MRRGSLSGAGQARSLPLKGGGSGRGSRDACVVLVETQRTPTPSLPLRRGRGEPCRACVLASNRLYGAHSVDGRTIRSAGRLSQDIPGIELCTREQRMDRRTGCLQSNVEYLQQLIAKNSLDAQQRFATANREIAAQKDQTGRRRIERLPRSRTRSPRSRRAPIRRRLRSPRASSPRCATPCVICGRGSTRPRRPSRSERHCTACRASRPLAMRPPAR